MNEHLRRLQQAARRILDSPGLQIRTADELELTVHSGVAALACEASIVIASDEVPNGLAGRIVLNSLVAHEMGHLNGTRPLEKGDAITRAVAAEVCLPWREWQEHRGPLRWAGHDSKFIRRLIHIIHRLENRGFRIEPTWAFNDEEYALSALAAYSEALGDEPARHDWRPLLDVLAKPAPAEFTKLWGRDVAQFFRRSVLKGESR